MVSLPNILFQVGAKGRKLSDIEFLSIKEFGTDGTDSKRVDVDNQQLSRLATTVEADLATQTASGGKDMYIAKGYFVTARTAGVTFNITVRLYLNGVVIETFKLENPVLDEEFAFTFKTTSRKVTTGQIIKITVQNSVSAAATRSDTSGGLLLWEEDTNASPQIPSI